MVGAELQFERCASDASLVDARRSYSPAIETPHVDKLERRSFPHYYAAHR